MICAVLLVHTCNMSLKESVSRHFQLLFFFLLHRIIHSWVLIHRLKPFRIRVRIHRSIRASLFRCCNVTRKRFYRLRGSIFRVLTDSTETFFKTSIKSRVTHKPSCLKSLSSVFSMRRGKGEEVMEISFLLYSKCF
jgi:hypothetical protein